jgi:hypothetical protein
MSDRRAHRIARVALTGIAAFTLVAGGAGIAAADEAHPGVPVDPAHPASPIHGARVAQADGDGGGDESQPPQSGVGGG